VFLSEKATSSSLIAITSLHAAPMTFDADMER
jgi:hypothetical protein